MFVNSAARLSWRRQGPRTANMGVNLSAVRGLLGFIELYLEKIRADTITEKMKLLVTGLPGVGKTSLLQALADTAPNPGGFLTSEVLKMLTFSILRSI